MWTESDMIGRKTEEQKTAPAAKEEAIPASVGIISADMTKEDLEHLRTVLEKSMQNVKPVLFIEETVPTVEAVGETVAEPVAETPAETVEEPAEVSEPAPVEEMPANATESAPAVIVMGGGLPTEEYTAEQVEEKIAMMEQKDEPDPCPFCGEQVKLTYFKRWHVTGHAVTCVLSANFSVGKTKEQMLAAWNTRRC